MSKERSKGEESKSFRDSLKKDRIPDQMLTFEPKDTRDDSKVRKGREMSKRLRIELSRGFYNQMYLISFAFLGSKGFDGSNPEA